MKTLPCWAIISHGWAQVTPKIIGAPGGFEAVGLGLDTSRLLSPHHIESKMTEHRSILTRVAQRAA